MQVGDVVLVSCQREGNLEPLWKGLYLLQQLILKSFQLGSTPPISKEHWSHPKMNGNWKSLLILLSCICTASVSPVVGNNLHVPQKLTWQVFSQTSKVIWSTSKVAPLYTWWSMLTPDFCQLVNGLDSWDIPDTDPQNMPLEVPKRFSPRGKFGCGSPEARCHLGRHGFYICP